MQVHGCEVQLVTELKVWNFWASVATGPVVVDFETNGQPIWDPEFKVIGIALAFYVGAALRGFYIPVFEAEMVEPKKFVLKKSRAEAGLVRSVLAWLEGKDIIGHNLSYDGTILKLLDVPVNLYHDTMVGLHLTLPGETYIPKKDENGNFVLNARSGKYQMERRSLKLKWAMVNILGWKESNEAEVNAFIRKNKHKKGKDLWICPLDLIWFYGVLDAIATYRLYEKQKPELEKLNASQITKMLMDYISLLGEQTLKGTNFDRASALNYQLELNKEINTALEKFLELAQEKITACEIEEFNINSIPQLRILFFTSKGFNFTPVSFTENGDAALDADSLKAYGLVGSTLAAYKTKVKLSQFLTSYLEHAKDGKIHISSNVCGQISGRVSQYEPSLLQMPRRDKRMMQLFTPEKGWLLMQVDYLAIEPCVLTAFSRDPVLRAIYTNPDIDKNFDVYLELGLRQNYKLPNGRICKDYVAEHYQSGMDNASFAKAKKALKQVRDKMKVVQLALGYQGTELTLMDSLGIPYNEAKQIYKDYWETFKGVFLFNKFLTAQAAKGPLYTFHGRPLLISYQREKDVLNTLIQASGHDILMHMVLTVGRLAKERGIPMKPYIADFHDETIWAFRKDYAEEALQVYDDSVKIVNEYLRSTGWFDFDLKAPVQSVPRRPYWGLNSLDEIEK